MWLVQPAAGHLHCNSLSLGSVGWPPWTQGMGWQSPLSPLTPTAYLGLDLQGTLLTKPRTYTRNLSTWVNQHSCPLPIHNHWGLTWMSHHASNRVRVKEGDWGSFQLSRYWAAFIVISLSPGSGSGRECWAGYCCSCCWWGVGPHSP